MAILASPYYTGHVHSILGQNLNVSRRRRFGHLFFINTIPLGNFRFLAENRGQFLGGTFFHKFVLGSSDNTLSNF